MASFILGVAGASLGGAVGYPALGWIIGSAIGASLFAPTLHHEGPRLNDLKVQSSSWGKMIPIVYGSMRMAGNLIWATDIRETRHVEHQGGKGGPAVESSSFTYSVSMAISLCEGPIFGIRKIWANGELIYNTDPGADAETLLNNQANHLTVYTGSETQLPDSTIEADKGAGNVPAYRGQAYVVFRDLQLVKFGNRIPNLEFEVVQAGTEIGFRRLVSRTNPDWSTDANFLSSSLMLSVEEGVIRTTRIDASDAPVRVFGLDGRFLGFEARRWEEQRVLMNHFKYLVCAPGDDFIEIRKDAIRPPPWGDLAFPALVLYKNGVPWWPEILPANETLAGAVMSADRKIVMLTTFVVADGAARGMRWYQFLTDGRLYRSGPVQADALHQPWFNWSPGPFIDVVPRNHAAALESDYTHLWCHTYDKPRSFLYAIDGNGVLARVQGFNSAAWSDDPAIYADEGVCVLVSYISVMIFTRNAAVTPNKVALSQIVRDQCARSGLAAGEIDVATLDDEVSGYAIARQGNARAAITPLQHAYFFDAADSEGQIKFVRRGGVPVATIPLEDLAARHASDEAAPPLLTTRAQASELPASVSVTYLNADSDYQVGTETSQRLLAPSQQKLTDELGIAMSPDKAAQVSEVLLYDAQVSRTTCSFSTSRKYAALEPTDVVLVQTPDGSRQLRLTKKTDEGGLLRFEAVADDATVYASVAAGGSQMVLQQWVNSPGPTRLQFLDIPILRDEDDDAGLYVAMGGYKDTWRGATLFRSDDGLGFDAVASVEHGAVMGVTLTALGPWAGQNFPDEASTVEVSVIAGTLASMTFDALLNGGNAALIGSEIVQYRSATLVGPNRYRLSGMLRGRQGTGHLATTHTANEIFVLLRPAGTLRVNEGMAALNAPRYYKAASFGSTQAKAGAYRFTNAGKGLKPCLPVHLVAARQPNGDWLLRWVRRTRVDGLWRDGVDAGLGEASEAYELEILQGATVRRTMASATPAITYSAAQQVADFGTLQTGLMVRLYQLSATIGRSDALIRSFTTTLI